MARPKTGARQIRIWMQRLDLLPTIREHMLRTVDQNGVGLSPDFQPSKGANFGLRAGHGVAVR